MRRLLVLTLVTTALTAAAPGPEPIITLDGVAAAAKLAPEAKAAFAPRVKALNAALEKIAAQQSGTRSAARSAHGPDHHAMAGIHEECRKLHDEIISQLNPEQQAAFFEYVHEQMKAAGIQMAHPPHGERAHPPHGERNHPAHGNRAHSWDAHGVSPTGA